MVQLDDLGLGHVLGGLGGEAHHQHRADREVRGQERRWRRAVGARPAASGVQARRADYDVRRRPRRTRRRSPSAVVGVREVDDHVAVGQDRRPAACPAPGRHGHRARGRSPPPPPRRSSAPFARPHRRHPTADQAASATRRGQRFQRATEELSSPPMPAALRRVSGVQLVGELAQVIERDRVDALDDLVDREHRHVGQHRGAEAVHARRRRLQRQHDAALDVLLGAHRAPRR